MAAVTNEKKNLNSQTEDVSEFIMLLKQMSDSDRMVIKGMMMWAAGENSLKGHRMSPTEMSGSK